MLKQQVLDTIKKYGLINYGDGIVVGISGGYDSVCLLHILYSVTDEFKLKLYPVHINHMLRGEEAQRDEDFVRNFCSSLGLDLHVQKMDVAAKAKQERISLEEAGRNVRYAEFNKVAQIEGAGKIAVAHSRNDQAETILMRIFRGTGIEGLRGIEYKRDNIIRPLLDVDRKQIESYARENGLEAVTDSSNQHTDYFRNRIRLNVIPEINLAVGADITENLLRLSKIVVADEDFLRYNAELYYKKALVSNDFQKSIELDLAELKKMHNAIMSRVLRMAVSDTCGSLEGIGYIHIENLMELVRNGRTGARIDIPHGIVGIKQYNTLEIRYKQAEKKKSFEHKLDVDGKIYIDELKSEILVQKVNFETNNSCYEFINKNSDAYTKFIDFDKLNLNENVDFVIRNRRDGDIFKPLNSNGTKKLKEYFIDNKIPRENRDGIPLIARNKEIIWIIGNKTSDNYKVTDNTKSVLMIKFIKQVLINR